MVWHRSPEELGSSSSCKSEATEGSGGESINDRYVTLRLGEPLDAIIHLRVRVGSTQRTYSRGVGLPIPFSGMESREVILNENRINGSGYASLGDFGPDPSPQSPGRRASQNLMPASEGDNDLGYWESWDFKAVHDEMLESVGSSWDDLTEFPNDWYRSPTAGRFRERILEVLERDFSDLPIFVIKDPRVCRFVPFWIDILDRFEAAPHFILPIRNPLEVAGSLKKRNGYPVARTAMIWLRHVLDAEHTSRDRPRSLVTYEALLDDWGSTVAKIGRELDLAWPRLSHTATVEIEEFLSTDHRHNCSSREKLRAHPQIVGWVEQTYDALVRAATEEEGDLRERLDKIRAEVQTAERA
ncbi:hypothetical protein BH23PLA1_BH23PLA1_16750 [soil metagenome]